jgi:micrococcal nuclease
MKLTLFSIIILALLTNLSFGSDVYKCSDKDGRTYYSTNPCEGGKKEGEVKIPESNPNSEIPETAPESKTIFEHATEPFNGGGSSHAQSGKTPQCSVFEVIDGDTFDCSLTSATAAAVHGGYAAPPNPEFPKDIYSHKAPYNQAVGNPNAIANAIPNRGTTERIRLIGVDTPESEDNPKAERDAERSGQSLSSIFVLGEKASEFTKSYLKRGTNLRLEFDVQQEDNYGRLLAYVYLPDGTMLNALLLQEGYAQIMTIPPNVKYADTFLRIQEEAREANRGLWGLGMR